MAAVASIISGGNGPNKVIHPRVAVPTPDQLRRLDPKDREILLKLLSEPLEFVYHQLFDKPLVEELLYGSKAILLPRVTHFEESREHEPVLDEEETSLTTSQELLLFQRYNYSRMRLGQLLVKYAGKRMPSSTLREALAWEHRAIAARGHIVRANIPLVLAMAKRTRLNGLDFNELISEGNFALLRSVNKFDCSRGFKFSTYACRAILKSFSRVAMKTNRYRGHFPTEYDPMMEKSDLADTRHDDVEANCVADIHDILTHNRALLNEIEKTVIRERFALGAISPPLRGKTLEQVGSMIGVTKERVRQIQNKALAKIRSILDEQYLTV